MVLLFKFGIGQIGIGISGQIGIGIGIIGNIGIGIGISGKIGIRDIVFLSQVMFNVSKYLLIFIII